MLDRSSEDYSQFSGAMIKAEEQALVELRNRGVIGDGVMRRVLRELDLERVLLDSREPVIEPPRELRIDET